MKPPHEEGKEGFFVHFFRLGRTFAGRSGLVSGGIHERESAASVDTTEDRDLNQQKPHFELDGVRAPTAG